MNMDKPRVCAYARVSTGLEQQKESCDNQIELYTQKIQSNPDWEFVGIYADPGFTGTKDDRPEFKRMLKDAEKHRIDIILVKSISRFARNTLISIQTIRHLQELGVAVIFEKENLDTSKPYSEMMLTILSAFAQEESRSISERVTKGKRMRAANGEVSWTPTYGYRKGFMIAEEEAKIIRRIFDEYEKGRTFHVIAEGLNLEGAGDKSWYPSEVRFIVTNERYAGDVLTNKSYTESHLTHKAVPNRGEVAQAFLKGHHKGIVTREQFERANYIRKLRNEQQYPFGEYLICPYCGKPLRKSTEDRYAYWVCEEDRFFAKSRRVEEAVLKAYAKLEGKMDERTREIKDANPEMDKVDYWWVEELIERITFGKHLGNKDLTLTVHWICGEKTTVPSGMETVFKTQQRINERADLKKPKRGQKRVIHVPKEGKRIGTQ